MSNKKINANSIDCVPIHVTGAQKVYYLPNVHGKTSQVVSRVYIYAPTESEQWLNGYRPIMTAEQLETASLTVAAQNSSSYICKDLPARSFLISNWRNATPINAEISFDKTYITFQYLDDDTDAYLLLYLVREASEQAKPVIGKVMPVTLANTSLTPAKLQDSITGQQGRLYRIEALDTTPGFVSLLDYDGRYFETIPLNWFSGKVFNPLQLNYLNVDWQNSHVYTTSPSTSYWYFQF